MFILSGYFDNNNNFKREIGNLKNFIKVKSKCYFWYMNDNG